MANGIKLSKLRKDIQKYKRELNHQELFDLWRETPAINLGLTFYDRKYISLPKEVWNDILQHIGIGEFNYKSEISDCDDFAFALRGRIPLELKVNGIGVVLDHSGGHAYNAILHHEGIEFIEPQGANPYEWWVKRPGEKGMYDMENGTVEW